MQKTIDETNYRREKQIAYNLKNNIIPKPLNKSIEDHLSNRFEYMQEDNLRKVAEQNLNQNYSKTEIQKMVREMKKEMESAAKALDFIQAAKIRDEIKRLEAFN
jgi:excinuclease ABC subunit B